MASESLSQQSWDQQVNMNKEVALNASEVMQLQQSHGDIHRSKLDDVVANPLSIDSLHLNETGTASGFFHQSKDITIGQGVFTEIHGSQYNTTNIFQPQPQPPSPTLNLATKHLSSLFTGQEEYLQKLRKHFNNPSSSIKRRSYLLYGLGGIGKTQICLKFMEEIEDEIPHVFWVDATSEDTIIFSLKAIAQNNALFAGESRPSIHQILQTISKMTETWFMIYDNADGPPSVIQKHLPKGNKGNIIITSRNGALMRLTSNCGTQVIQMKLDEARLLLARAAGLDETSIEDHFEEIVVKLGCIPLAVDMAGAYIQATCCSPAHYLGLFSKQCKRLLNDSKYIEMSDYGYTTYGAWEISMQRIESRAADEKYPGAQSAIKILNTLAFLHHIDVPLDLFKRGIVNYMEDQLEVGIKNALKPELFHLDGAGNWDQYLFNSGIQELLSFSFIQRGVIHNTLSMHPLVHKWISDRLQSLDIQQRYQDARLILCSSVVLDYMIDDYAYWLSIIPHIKANDEYGKDFEIPDAPGDESRVIGFIFEMAGFYAEAEQHLSKLINKCSEEHGQDHPETLIAMHNLAMNYEYQGRWDDSQKLLEEILEAEKLRLGHDHSDTLTTMESLACTYQKQGRWDDAEMLFKEALDARTLKLGHDHPSTLNTIHNLTTTYWHQGKQDDAERLFEEILEATKLALGHDHPNRLATMHNLASTYQYQGKLDDAERLFEEVLESRKLKLGNDHPSTLTTRNGLALTYLHQGKLDDAERLFKGVLEARKQKLGHDHPNTLTTMHNLACTYQKQGRWDDAEKLFKEVLATSKLKLGHDHPGTLTTLHHLATAYQDQGRWDDADNLFCV
ncbi:hypothetical protein AMATHDRAFT_184845 [Amanita thiersii Skay4041]|uniref:Uncharacterized protein n=1 Tax=Amanita thiersii Skay4041 TaxID=703135 RepID=A0A2A9NB59_9AGAR|nr:hypothetical protein AMATHDRAFT_184845 [Amanita thiersii Skay4041]